MSLVKKTVILRDFDDRSKGVVNFFRIGDEATFKSSVDDFSPGLRLAVRTGSVGVHVVELSENKREFPLPFLFDVGDVIEVLLAFGSKPQAYGSTGAAGGIELLASALKTSESEPEKTDKSVAMDTEIGGFGVEEDSAVKPVLQSFHTVQTGRPEDVRGLIREMFLTYPAYPELSEKLPASKWVKIEYNDDDCYYFGVLERGERVTHLVYAIKSPYDQKPPKEIEGICEFFPLDFAFPRGEGWWMIYQDSETLQPVTSWDDASRR